MRTPLRTALLLATLFAAITFLIHLVSSLWGSHLGYGFFRDELYFLVCGHHLDWGYVDQPPLIALITWPVQSTVCHRPSAGIRAIFCGDLEAIRVRA